MTTPKDAPVLTETETDTDSGSDPDRIATVLAAQVDDYADLSRSYAARGDSRRAALAIWAADVRTVQCLLWEGGLASAADPAHELRAVAAAVETALTSREVPAGVSVRTVVENAREALAAAFDESVHALLSARFVTLDHLDRASAPDPGAANLAVSERLDGRSGEQLVGDLLTAVVDCRAVASVMAEVGDDEEARRQAALADLAAFEAYLVMVSAGSGDATLATTELRWDLAAAKAGRPGHAGEPEDLVSARRAVMRSVVAPAEEQALLSVLDHAAPGRQG